MSETTLTDGSPVTSDHREINPATGIQMKTLDEIVCLVRDGERPDYDDMRFAICAMDALMTFDRQAFIRLAIAERDGKKPLYTNSAQWQFEEHFNRHKRAGEKPPKDYIGWNNNPDNLDFQIRRGLSKKINKIMSKGYCIETD